MVLTINKTGNKSSEVPYNNAEHAAVLNVVNVDHKDIYTHYDRENGEHAYILNPVMDTLSLTLHLNARKQQNMLIRKLKSWDSDIAGVSVQALKNWGKSKIENKSKHASYNRKYKITIDSIDVLLQLQPKIKSHRFMRLKLQPSLFMASGLQKLWATLKLISDGIIDADYVCENGNLTHIDWAIDYLNVPADDLILLKPSSFRKKTLIISSDGKIETDYIQHGEDAKEHKHSKAYVYDKLKHPSKDKKYTGSNIPVSRVEFRTYPEHNSFSQFVKKKFSLTNRFEDHEVIDLGARMKNKIPTSNKIENEYVWKLFLDHMRIRGRTLALETLPEELREEYKMILNKQLFLSWHPSELWDLTPNAVNKFLCKTVSLG